MLRNPAANPEGSGFACRSGFGGWDVPFGFGARRARPTTVATQTQRLRQQQLQSRANVKQWSMIKGEGYIYRATKHDK